MTREPALMPCSCVSRGVAAAVGPDTGGSPPPCPICEDTGQMPVAILMGQVAFPELTATEVAERLAELGADSAAFQLLEVADRLAPGDAVIATQVIADLFATRRVARWLEDELDEMLGASSLLDLDPPVEVLRFQGWSEEDIAEWLA